MNMMEGSGKRHFVLVHGMWHGAWCWYKVAALLESAGHRVTAVDLAACGADPKRLDEVGSIGDYVAPLMEAMAALSLGERVVLVGHSFGGVALSYAMEALPERISVAVFVSAFMPGTQIPLSDVLQESSQRIPSDTFMDSQFFFDQGLDQPPTSIVLGSQCLSSMLYQLCASEDLKLANMLVRPAKIFKDRPILLTEDRFGIVDRAYIVCKEDKMIKEDFQRWLIERSPVKEVKEIKGADHMVMLSKPQESFNCLLALAEKYV